MIRSPAIALLVLSLLAAACRTGSGDGAYFDRQGGDGGAGDDAGRDARTSADAFDWSEDCPTAEVFTGMTCTQSTEGSLCPGTVYCEGCGNVTTPCSCTVSEAGFRFVCADDCASSCPADEDAGADIDSGGGVSCEALCAVQRAVECPTPIESCEADCASLESMLPSACLEAWEAVQLCMLSATYTCDAEIGDPVPIGCDAQVATLQECISA